MNNVGSFEPSECLWCKEMIARGELRHALLPQYHFACALRAVAGSIAHLEKRCSCYVPGATCSDPVDLTLRESAQLVADYLRDHPPDPLPDPRRNAN